MRKFVIKHRTKRKYTKKSEEISSFSFSKTAFGMMPLLILLIVFMSTIIISTPLRQALTSISFTFELPRISFANPLSFLESLAGYAFQIVKNGWTIMQIVIGAVSQGTGIIWTKATIGTIFFLNFLQYFIVLTMEDLLFLFQEVIKIADILIQFNNAINSLCLNLLQNCILFAAKVAVHIFQFSLAAIQSITRQIELFFIFFFQITITAGLSCIQFFVSMGRTILDILATIANFIDTTTTNFVKAIVHIIEIPFKILYSFGLLLKPYVDIFASHVQKSGTDFSNMFTSLGKIASLIVVQK